MQANERMIKDAVFNEVGGCGIQQELSFKTIDISPIKTQAEEEKVEGVCKMKICLQIHNQKMQEPSYDYFCFPMNDEAKSFPKSWRSLVRR